MKYSKEFKEQAIKLSDEIGLKRYIKNYGMRFYRLYMQNCFKFENMLTKSLFELYNI